MVAGRIKRETAALGLTAVALVFAPMAIGSTSRWAIFVVGVLAVFGAALFVTSRRRLTAPPLLIVLAAAISITALQLIPFPAFLVGFVSPKKQQLVVENAVALGSTPPTFIPLSIDPPATLVELTKFVIYALLAYTCLRLAASRTRRRALLAVVALSGAAVAAAALVHEAMGIARPFGFYEAEHVRHPQVVAPLLNANHLAGFMALCGPASFGLAISSLGARRYAWLAALLAMAMVALLSGSRAGVAVFGLGLVVTGILLVAQRRHGDVTAERGFGERFIFFTIMFCAAALLATLAADKVVDQYAETKLAELSEPYSKFAAWRASEALLHDYAATGVGAGAFEPGFTGLHDFGGARFSHLENQYLQTLIEWGVVFCGLILLPVLTLLRLAYRRARSGQVEASAAGGCLALGVHNVVDFSLSLTGVSCAMIAMLAIVGHVPLTEVRRREARRRARQLRGLAVASSTLVIVALLTPSARQAHADAETTESIIAHGRTENALSAAKTNYFKHPSDYRAAGLLAAELFSQRDSRAVAVVNRALRMNPKDSGLHHLAARMLHAGGRTEQALVEYALALEHARAPDAILDELLRLYGEPEEVLRGLPRSPKRTALLAKKLSQRGRMDVAVAYLEAAVTDTPQFRDELLLLSRFALLSDDGVRAVAAARRARALDDDVEASIALAKALGAIGEQQAGIDLLNEISTRRRSGFSQRDSFNILFSLGTLYVHAGALDSAREVLNQALPLANDREGRARVHRRLATIEEKLGNHHKAAWEARRARELSSTP